MSASMISPMSTAASVPPIPTPEPTPAPTPEPTPEPTSEIDGTALAEAINAMRRGPEWHEACDRFNAGERTPALYDFVLKCLTV